MGHTPAMTVRALLCALLLAAASAASGAAPAEAAPDGTLRAVTRPYFHASLHPDTAPTGAEVLRLEFAYDGPRRAAKLTVDALDIAKVARVTGGADGCSPHTPVFTCAFPLHPDSEGWNRQELVVKPVPGARPGDTGVLHYTLDPEGMPPVGASVTVIAGRPELRVNKPEPVVRQSVGEPFAVPVVIRNIGDVPAHGVTLYLDGNGDLTLGRHTGCRYAAHGTAALCTFPDAVIEPGGSYRVTPAPRPQPGEHALDTQFFYTAWASRTRPYRSLPPGGTEQGTGEPLSLTETAHVSHATAFTDSQDPAGLAVPVRNEADYEAFGDSLSGDVGTEHTVSIGMRNNGPADPHVGKVSAVFTVPPGAEVVKAPYDPELEEEMFDQRCRTRDSGRHYTCTGHLAAGERTGFEFTLRIVAKDDRPGRVSVSARLYGSSGHRRIKDPDHANDEAPVRLHATGDGPARRPGTGGTDAATVAWSSGVGVAALAAAAFLAVRLRRRRSARP